MTTNLDIIKRSLRKLGQLAGGDEPTVDQASDGMAVLSSLYAELIAQGTFGPLYDVLATANYTANEWERVRASNGVTVTLPTTITNPPAWQYDYGWRTKGPADYGWRYSCLPRAPLALAPVCVITSAGVATFSLYNADVGAWVTIAGASVTQQSAFPLPMAYQDGFACLLAERVADEYTVALSEATKRGAALCRYMLSNKGDRPKAPTVASYF